MALLLAVAPTPGHAADSPLRLEVDATDREHRVFRVRQFLPVQPGPLRLYFPRWLPGEHAPVGDASRLAGLVVRGNGQALAWARDPLDSHAFTLTVPAGVAELQIEFAHLSPVSPDSGRVVVTPQMLNLQWQSVLLYPAGPPADAITVQASLRLPDGWQWGSALRASSSEGGTVRFAPVSLAQLVDSPVFAGQHFRRIALDPEGAARPVMLNLMTDDAGQLSVATEAQLEAHRRLVQQADKLFASRHFAHYDFLLALSDELGGIGLEHHESSENALKPQYFEAWDKSIAGRELLAHEYTHSWNGKFRRPADLSTPDFQAPMQDTLLWLYEGQTEFWGKVLSARSGLVDAALIRDSLAVIAAAQDERAGRTWRNLQDTSHDLLLGRPGRRDWEDYQRTLAEVYREGVLVWLDADMLIRERSGGVRSLDDFARAFFGVADGQRGPLTYTFDDVVAALGAVQPHDWAGFLRQRLDGHDPRAPLDGLARAGWTLAWDDKPSDNFKAGEVWRKSTDFTWSLGLSVGADGKLRRVRWNGPAFRAGLAPGMVLVAVGQRAFKPERLKAAVTANRDGRAPIELLVRDGELFRTVTIDWRGGLRYPHLVRIEGSEDRLSRLLAPR